MATITYRQLINNEPQWGQGQANFLSDRDAVAQAVITRLKLFEGEWWADLQDGTPYWQNILGSSGSDSNVKVITQLLIDRIRNTPYVIGTDNVQSSFDAASRTYKFSCTVNTQFGAIAVSNIPTPPPQTLPQ